MDGTSAEEREGSNGSMASQESVEDLDRRIREFGNDHPLLALGMVVAAGYLVGRVVSRL